MGYTTDFMGQFEFNKPLDDETYDFLYKLANTRRMKRDLPKEYGIEGEFFVDGTGFSGQEHTPDIIDYNSPPRTQPSLWLQWTPNEDRSALEGDTGEKFYCYVEWLEYIIEKLLKGKFKDKGYVLNGKVEWRGESWGDTGTIKVKENVIKVKPKET